MCCYPLSEIKNNLCKFCVFVYLNTSMSVVNSLCFEDGLILSQPVDISFKTNCRKAVGNLKIEYNNSNSDTVRGRDKFPSCIRLRCERNISNSKNISMAHKDQPRGVSRDRRDTIFMRISEIAYTTFFLFLNASKRNNSSSLTEY